MRRLSRTLVGLLPVFAVGCSVVLPLGDEYSFDGRLDGSTSTDGGPDAEPAPADGGEGDAAASACEPACGGETPHCEPESRRCVECLEPAHCEDGDYCTSDRCGLDGVCRNEVDAECVSDLDAGTSHVCAVRGGQVYCWGANDSGQLGTGESGGGTDRNRPWGVSGLTDAVQVAAGASHTCALRRTGQVACWGLNLNGELGADPATVTEATSPRMVAGLSGVTQLAAAAGRSCAVLDDGSAVCWGGAPRGDGSTEEPSHVPTPVGGIAEAVAVGMGEAATCFVVRRGEALCFGSGSNGQLGHGDTTSHPLPMPVVDVADFLEVGVGSDHACGRRGDGSVVCWGEGGRIGDGEITPSSRPIAVAGGHVADSLGVGTAHSCLANATGVWCWGFGDSGELGNGMAQNQLAPVQVADLPGALRVTAGSAVSCALVDSRTISCWGANNRGQLGDGSTAMSRAVPGEVSRF